MPNPIPGFYYNHHGHNCPVYVQRIKPNGLVHYFMMITDKGEWPYCVSGDSFPDEFDPWPIRGLQSKSLMERSESDGSS